MDKSSAGLMQYGNGYFGVLEANYGLAFVQLISAVCGVQFWSQPMASLLRLAPNECDPSSACAVAGSPAALVTSLSNSFINTSVLTALFSFACICMGLQVDGQVYRVFSNLSGAYTLLESHQCNECMISRLCFVSFSSHPDASPDT